MTLPRVLHIDVLAFFLVEVYIEIVSELAVPAVAYPKRF